MEILETKLEGPLLLKPRVHGDERGFFLESYRRHAYAVLGIIEEFVQDNHSRSGRSVVRGMHFQIGSGQSKLIRCVRGAVFDVLVDVRRGSPTFGEWEAYELNEGNRHQLYCPVGFAHGFCVTSSIADVLYKCSAYYDPRAERGIAYNDPDVAIEWPELDLTPSARDAGAPSLREVAPELTFDYEA